MQLAHRQLSLTLRPMKPDHLIQRQGYPIVSHHLMAMEQPEQLITNSARSLDILYI